MREQIHVRIVPMTGDHLDEVAELEMDRFYHPGPEHAGGGAAERLRRLPGGPG